MKPKRSQEELRAANIERCRLQRKTLPQRNPAQYADNLATYIERIESHAHDDDFSYKVPTDEM